ncbi:glutamate decarboxylase gad1 [Entomophthora muscae]|uniref:Glutamate decarboxylase gad1 n=1 Tax=Entomophthora muscae TaxID=34485 RepID=A0ACC2SSH6_9FUNG|nr:glutamate decarboxylase gad1 [Entomophthora muscae]
MPLSNHIDYAKLVRLAEKEGCQQSHITTPAYSSRYQVAEVPKFKMAESGMPPQAAYRMVHDELMLDGKPELNCATFLTQWMEPEAEALIHENINKNFVDVDGFPSSIAIHERCISILAELWGAPVSGQAQGTVCGGSSEALILGGLAMKWAWKKKCKESGRDDSKPNVVLGSNAHCCIEKFARYFDVDARIVPVTVESNYVMDPKSCVAHCDENTIGVFSILGSTYTGHYEDVLGLSDALDKLQEEKGFDIPIHVDAASGGFIAPFATPDLNWDFGVKRVVSINTSGHKYGLVYAGLGWVVWKSKDYLHEDLIFQMHYLGAPQRSFSLNFSRPSTHLIAQYYNFVRLGQEGYRNAANGCLSNARFLSRALEKSEMFDVLSRIHHKHPNKEFLPGIPLVAFTPSARFKELIPDIDVSDISGLIRTRGWMLPVYNLPQACQDTRILRVVVKEGMSRDLVARLIADIISACNSLMSNKEPRVTDPLFEVMALECSEDPFIAKKLNTNPTQRHRKHVKNTFSSVC